MTWYFLTAAVLAALLGLGLPRLLRLRAQRRRWSDLPEARWLSAAESPLGRPVVDCRGYARLMPCPDSPELRARFARTRRAPVARLCGSLPEGAAPEGQAVAWEFPPADVARLRAGFAAATLDDRWLIRHRGGRLYFQRSWSGALGYVAELGPRGITRVWLRRGAEEGAGQQALSLRLLRFLIDSHLLDRPAAVPVPVDLAEDPLKMAHFAFGIAGPRGIYAEAFPPPSQSGDQSVIT